MPKARKPIRSHKGGRTKQSNVRRTPRVQLILDALAKMGISQADLLEEIALIKERELGISIPSEATHDQ